MTERTLYICDYCGKTFDHEEACEAHEKAELYDQIKKNVTFFDCDFEPINPIGGTLCIDDIQGILIKNEKGRESVKEYYDEASYCDPLWDWPKSDIQYPLAIVLNDNGYWDNVAEKFSYWKQIRDSFDKVIMQEG